MIDDNYSEEKSPILTFKHPLTVEVYEPDFEALSSLQFLDVERLATGKHSVEIGYMTGGCCRELVHAIVEDGMVVGIKAEGCEDAIEEEVPEEISELFSITVEKLELPSFQPVPVAEFMAKAKEDDSAPTSQCYWICVWRWCLFCCEVTMTSDTPKCWIERRRPGGPIIVIGGNP